MPNWKRKFMEAEHRRRKQEKDWKAKNSELARINSDLNETNEYLQAQLRISFSDVTTKNKIIRTMRNVLSAHNIPTIPSLLSFNLCDAADDHEMCPLSQQVIF
jgi:hypothetical protein